jgi:hypothetical protein
MHSDNELAYQGRRNARVLSPVFAAIIFGLATTAINLLLLLIEWIRAGRPSDSDTYGELIAGSVIQCVWAVAASILLAAGIWILSYVKRTTREESGLIAAAAGMAYPVAGLAVAWALGTIGDGSWLVTCDLLFSGIYPLVIAILLTREKD